MKALRAFKINHIDSVHSLTLDGFSELHNPPNNSNQVSDIPFIRTKVTRLFITLVITFCASAPIFSQNTNIDTVRLQRLDTDINRFIEELGDFVSSNNKTENVTEINLSATQLNKSSIVLLDSINQVFDLNNSTNQINAGMYYGLSAAFFQSYPALSAFYSSLASTSVLNGKTVPQYYNILKDVRDTSFRMSKKKKIVRLKKMELYMQDLYKKLEEIE